MLARGALVSILSLHASLALADYDIHLGAARQGAQDVRLDWTGGSPDYHVYRSTSPSGVASSGNQLGQTSANFWIDTPPAGTLFFYQVNGAGTPCAGDAECVPEEYCGTGSVCLPDLSDGSGCSGNSQCTSDHCANGFCCASGDCCASSADCAAAGHPPTCDSVSTCQGTRANGVCASSMCLTQTIGDDSACGLGTESQSCGPYPSVFCTGATNQVPPVCPTSCADDFGCDANAHCDASACLPDVAAGSSCDEPSDCVTGFCVDGVCCSSSCTGTCRACDVSGSVGTCTPLPDGTDPGGECGGSSCSGFYLGWTGDSCFRKADVTAAQATCGGDNACRTQSEECNAVTTPGSVAVTCNAQCQDPNLTTCTGTTAGTCTNVNPGNQSCGSGPCRVTVPQCNSGAPATCVPNSGASSPETCNSIDDNCDGSVDNGSFQDGFETNNVCGQVVVIAGVGSDQTQSLANPTIYPSGDVDYYRFTATETDSTCYCGFPSTDEDYRITTTLTVPPGSGSYEVCIGTVCDTWISCKTVNAGSSDSIVLNLDGTCTVGTTDSYPFYLKVKGFNPPGFACAPYTLSYFFDAGYCF